MVECQIGSVAVLRCCEKKWEKWGRKGFVGKGLVSGK